MCTDVFEPDYRHVAEVLQNRRPQRLPVYEHIVSPAVMEQISGEEFAALEGGGPADCRAFFKHYCAFFKTMTYDTVSYEVCITSVLPDGGALMGGRPGPIQSREEYTSYPWDEIPVRFWEKATPLFDALAAELPPGMKAIGGVGNGVFEIGEDLVGLEYLPLMQIDDPALYQDLYRRIGDTMVAIWKTFLNRYGAAFAAGRFGDDLGFRSSLLTNPATIREHILPQYKRIVDLVHSAGLPFLWHSCGCIFEVMEDVLALGVDAKHSNEDAIAPFDRWISSYGDRIGLLGGFDMDFLCARTEREVFDAVVEKGTRFRRIANGYALGSGNSIPQYVPVANYLAMLRGAQVIRDNER